MCDYSLHAVATRPAQVGETLITMTFRGTATRGFASENEPDVRGLHAARDGIGICRKCQIRQPMGSGRDKSISGWENSAQ